MITKIFSVCKVNSTLGGTEAGKKRKERLFRPAYRQVKNQTLASGGWQRSAQINMKVPARCRKVREKIRL